MVEFQRYSALKIIEGVSCAEFDKKLKVYIGKDFGKVYINDKPLNPRLDLSNHAPDRILTWGYGGSGASQLALAILADYFDDEFALKYYQDFKWEIIANLKFGEPFELTSDDLEKWRKKLNDKYLCAVCGKNYVNSDEGYDTCSECMSKI